MTYRRKLIEVSLPLEAINVASAREKSIRHGHPSTLHLWWARRPLAACRAVLFSSLVDDPSEYMPDAESIHAERERLFRIIEDLVIWENSNNEEVLDKAKLEIARSVARNLGVDAPIGKEAIREFLATKAPPVLDPFAGGGSIPLEAQRLGLRAYASDLNPVAVLINKALIEIPPKFANMPPVHPTEDGGPMTEGVSPSSVSRPRSKGKKAVAPELWAKEWKGAQGLAEDVRYYGKWMRDEAFKRIGHLYPPVTITKEILAERADLQKQGLKAGDQLTVIAWVWARSVKCPNPACGAQMPLISNLALSTKKGNLAWVQPIADSRSVPPKIRYSIVIKQPAVAPLKVGRGAQFRCAACGQIAAEEHIRNEFIRKFVSADLIAVVADSPKGRIFLVPDDFQSEVAKNARPTWFPDEEMNTKTSNLVSGRGYGITHWHELFTQRQLVALTTYVDLIGCVREKIISDVTHTMAQDEKKLAAYTDAVIMYLALGVSRLSDINNSHCMWERTKTQVRHVFTRQAIPMVWDFGEPNIFAEAAGDFAISLGNLSLALENTPSVGFGKVGQISAELSLEGMPAPMVSTDPPYYDNIGYADLSDFFYIWLRKSLGNVYKDIFSTMLTPKSKELVAAADRFDGNKGKAEEFFLNGLENVFASIRIKSVQGFPTTVYYAFKQAEEDNTEQDTENINTVLASTGWETMLEGLVRSGFSITGTWPMRTELNNRMIGIGTNALASSIILVCRPRLENATSCSRREFLSALKREVAPALHELQQGSIAPVDLAQAAIGPGMAVFSRYSAVLEADGKPMSVRTALTLINQALDEYLSEQEGEYDADTRWALSWYEQFGHNEAAYGVAETLSKAKNTSVNGLVEAGILEARGGKVRIYRRDELSPSPSGRGAKGEGWDPAKDKRLTAWEACQHLIYALENGGEESAAGLLAKLGAISEPARDLSYRLYTVCERKGWSQDALGYNMLVVAWPRLKELAARQKTEQGKLL